ncbi:DUF423 domain-containing protein [Alteromonas sediminis]|uniref:DUF423 domain-containing protein n=1 Tax=Alteromonas sediminis TaxID=2259342 RepID=A0A3N5YCV3_9ALTE|nr:DUF423 domain-containing protein [Alteromonas sediminis]RPJ67185.1 DUF423 domain-containing protein [Alteromonas sediminis]
MWHKYFLLVGLFYAMTAVALGAFGAHGLKAVLTDMQLQTFETAVRYQMYHALALIALSFVSQPFERKKWLTGCGLLCIGTAGFSCSLYAYIGTGLTGFAMVTPLGGSALILGWIWLIIAAWQGAGKTQ